MKNTDFNTNIPIKNIDRELVSKKLDNLKDMQYLTNSEVVNNILLDKKDVIPASIISKEPTAELRDNQKDSDSLPPYDELDQILEGLVEYELSTSELEKKGFSREEIKKVENLLYVSEYKRRQSAPGVKISLRNFGRDRRYPITNKFRDKIE